MQINSIIIKLVRNGAGIKPDYSITLYGRGFLEYQGNNNIKVKGKIEKEISQQLIVSILSEFKKYGFFSQKYSCSVDKKTKNPYSIISLSYEDKDGEIQAKSISHYDNDEKVPKEIIDLETFIDKKIGTDKWFIVNDVAVKSEPKKKKEKPVKVPKKTKEKVEKIPKKLKEKKKKISNKPKGKKKKIPIKYLSLIAIVIIFIFIMFFLISSDIFNAPEKNNIIDDMPEPIVIISFKSADSNNSSLSVIFNASGENFEGELVNYSWDFDDGFFSYEPNIVHNYSTKGVYFVSLTIIDSMGIIQVDSVKIQVDDSNGGLVVEYIPPEFLSIIPTNISERINNERPPKKILFYLGEYVNIDYEFTNVTHNESYDFNIDISLKLGDIEYKNYAKKYREDFYNGSGIFYINYEFLANGTWSEDIYTVSSILTDNISKISITENVDIYLKEP